jgi:hypothetical protein
MAVAVVLEVWNELVDLGLRRLEGPSWRDVDVPDDLVDSYETGDKVEWARARGQQRRGEAVWDDTLDECALARFWPRLKSASLGGVKKLVTTD